MPANGQNVGRDVSLQYIISGVPFSIEPSSVTSFDSSPETTMLKSKGLDGKARNGVIPDGWTGNIAFDRMSSSVDDWWAAVENAYYAGEDTGSGTILETIENPDGSTSQYRYTSVILVLDKLGEKKADDLIKGSIKFVASRRVRV